MWREGVGLGTINPVRTGTSESNKESETYFGENEVPDSGDLTVPRLEML
jgi:hypothetical protein